MAIELLIRLSDGTGNRKKGDIVSIKPVPNSGWGRGEGPPNYIIIVISDLNFSDAKQYKARNFEVNDIRIRSKYSLDITSLGLTKDSTLEERTLTKNTLISNIIDRAAEAIK